MSSDISARRAPQPSDRDGAVFDQLIDRRRSNSMKWAYANQLLSPDEAAADPLPMWVADMDFKPRRR